MKHYTLFLTILLATVWTTVVMPAQKDNKPPRGFKALFNGKDLTNWQGLIEVPQREKLTAEQLAAKQKEANEAILPHWTVNDGVLRYDGNGNSLQTLKDYEDFDLWVDWKILPGGDSGLYLRGCPQVQIWDYNACPEGSGGLYNNQKNPSKPLKCADKPIGEWNRFHIVMKGEIVSVWLNGELIVDNVTLENYWDRSKPVPAKGPIELQHHGNTLEFKNIFIKKLKRRG